MLINEDFFKENDDSYFINDVHEQHKVFDLYRYEPLQKFFYNDSLSENDVNELNKWLKDNKEEYVILYHGTSGKIDVMKDGLLKTSTKRRRSYQSQSGFVYLSIFPSSARTFGEMGYPMENDIVVYAITIKIKDLRPDRDQLRNKRLWGGIECGDTLGDSLIYGHGARVPRNIFPYEIGITNF